MSIRRNLDPESGDVVVMGHTGLFIQRAPKDVTMFPTGFGEEKYYHDADGFMRHHPPRTKWSHPYSYDPIEVVFTCGDATGSAYTDRMTSWDYTKFYDELGKLNKGKGEMSFSWSNRELVQKFCRRYFNDKSMTITRVVEMCNQSTGYPLWLISWNSKKDVAIKALYDVCKSMGTTPSQEALDAIAVKYQQYKPEPKQEVA